MEWPANGYPKPVGGRDSLQKSHRLATDILSWFSQSRGPIYVEDLENLLHESLLLSFNTEIEDGSIEEVYTYSLDYSSFSVNLLFAFFN
ncbi:hypothetical protein GH714_019983 [Hevea brasiliensis]|uniref:Uncharacterized protein n=1 Tax=Hevea brasiliensis TaxID=3981 RepID=A0A6A6K9S8_HEVBR|nr:hypothetical protein GH714_019983 [Hevea brasiliensis]